MILNGMPDIEKQFTHEAARSTLIIGMTRPDTERSENDDTKRSCSHGRRVGAKQDVLQPMGCKTSRAGFAQDRSTMPSWL
ncbi:hypothetical protein ATL42_1807 [Sanguibacter antarcticus]|uniref:Uncharacterized protein n=1 Tax=Sanguibacter antarcticus TaxID=372484 RepID=A0A2A9E4Y8_9MICO|nr:hypothetical protein ATL42_1807 [Sanguibacter antarcticus]